MVERTERGWCPTGRGHELLLTWALWSRGDRIGSRSTAGGWSEPLDSAHEEVPPESVIVCDRIIARLGVDHPEYRRVTKAYYLDHRAVWEIAEHMGFTTGYVRLMVQATCDHVARLHDAPR
jgi:hypothetical protein